MYNNKLQQQNNTGIKYCTLRYLYLNYFIIIKSIWSITQPIVLSSIYSVTEYIYLFIDHSYIKYRSLQWKNIKVDITHKYKIYI